MKVTWIKTTPHHQIGQVKDLPDTTAGSLIANGVCCEGDKVIESKKEVTKPAPKEKVIESKTIKKQKVK